MIPAVVGAAANISEPIIPGDTGWVLPGTAVTHTVSSGQNWTNPSNVTDLTSSFAGCSLTKLYPPLASDYTSRFIRATNFDFSAIPDGAVISGISTRFKWRKTDNDSSGTSATYLALDGSIVGDASSPYGIATTFFVQEETEDAGADPLWGAGLSVDDVKNNSTFGFFAGGIQVSGVPYYDTCTIQIEYMQMKIDWVAP